MAAPWQPWACSRQGGKCWKPFGRHSPADGKSMRAFGVYGNPLPACLAVVGFGAVDGTAYYGHLRKCRFDSLPVLARVHLLLGVAATVMTVVFLRWSDLVWP